jgi:hypothetical protein
MQAKLMGWTGVVVAAVAKLLAAFPAFELPEIRAS